MALAIDIDGAYDASEAIAVYKDANFLVVSKPAGMLTTSTTKAHALTDIAKVLDSAAPNLHPTSRLDRQVSGIVTFARTRFANKHVLRVRSEGNYQRQYVGLIFTHGLADVGSWRWPIGLDPRNPKRRKAVLSPADAAIAPKAAATHFKVVAGGDGLDAVLLQPQTGRTHQLRVHAAAAGAPLVGDVEYGGIRDIVLPDGRVCWAPRVMLHCRAIRLPTPDGRILTVRLTLPNDMQTFWTTVCQKPLNLADQWLSVMQTDFS